jgi:hypothetical protein
MPGFYSLTASAQKTSLFKKGLSENLLRKGFIENP